MSHQSNRMLGDKRPIYSIQSEPSPEPIGATVGYAGVTRIEVYRENGQDPQTWFNVWKVDFLYKRLNAAYIAEVTYKEE